MWEIFRSPGHSDDHITLYNFEKGSYSPELLITKNMNPDIVFHPMAQWKIIHIQKAFENGDESVELE